ncbi:hypothetical protein BC936DRAFT_144151 [Jimgerdemannia flammicorona]|uniref:Uncharacterized protein n=1 Tax=Jimgerdemannia flammicorona TaxID=994334 RepID=A0A433DCZ7_9FUNG|nr:hypothetical protein BC936DRAFT_144151 [Jimgerdemannia flammicorona]
MDVVLHTDYDVINAKVQNPLTWPRDIRSLKAHDFVRNPHTFLEAQRWNLFHISDWSSTLPTRESTSSLLCTHSTFPNMLITALYLLCVFLAALARVSPVNESNIGDDDFEAAECSVGEVACVGPNGFCSNATIGFCVQGFLTMMRFRRAAPEG